MGKILLLIAVVVLVWYGFRWFKRSGLRLTSEPRPRNAQRPVLDLERNPATGDYEPRRDETRR